MNQNFVEIESLFCINNDKTKIKIKKHHKIFI